MTTNNRLCPGSGTFVEVRDLKAGQVCQCGRRFPAYPSKIPPHEVEVVRVVDKPLVDAIRARDRVTIVDRFGKERTGTAVMRGPAGWVLNMGGRYGTPAVATEENTTRVKPARR